MKCSYQNDLHVYKLQISRRPKPSKSRQSARLMWRSHRVWPL